MEVPRAVRPRSQNIAGVGARFCALQDAGLTTGGGRSTSGRRAAKKALDGDGAGTSPRNPWLRRALLD